MKPAWCLLLLALNGCRSDDPPTAIASARPSEARPVASQTANPALLQPGDVVDGKRRAVRLGGMNVALTPFVVDLPDGPARSECGVLVEGQRVMTLGSGDLDTYVCARLVDAQPMPNAGPAQRLGMMYDANSREGLFRTAVVLMREPSGQWTVDAPATTTFDDLVDKNWSAFAAALQKSR